MGRLPLSEEERKIRRTLTQKKYREGHREVVNKANMNYMNRQRILLNELKAIKIDLDN